MAPELWGTAEIAEAMDVDRSLVYRWIRTRGFPKPVAELRAGRVWNAEAVRKWRRETIAERRRRRAF